MSSPTDRLVALAWAAAGAGACAAMAPLQPNLLEEGFALHVAQRIASGEHLYRDIVFFSGPVPFEALALLFRAFGDEIAIARGAVVVLHALTTGLAFDLARRAGAGALSHVAAAALAFAPILLFPFFSIYFHTTIAFYLIGIAVHAGLRATESTRWGFLAGATIALVGMTKQSLGAVLAVSLLPAVVLGTARGGRLARAATVSLGLAAMGGFIVAVFAARGDLGALYHGVIELPLTLGGTFGSAYINLWPPGELTGDARFNAPFYLPNLAQTLPEFRFVPGFLVVSMTQLAYLLPWVALGLTAVARATGPLPVGVWVNGAGLLALTANLFPRADWGHLVLSLPPAAVQIVLLLAVRSRLRRPGRTARRIALALGLVAAVTGARLWSLSRPPSLGPRVPLRPIGEAAGSIAPAVHYLLERVEEGTPIFVARAEPLIYFATKTRNPTPFEGIIPGFQEEQEEQIIRGLEEVRYVVMSDVDQPFMSFYSDQLPLVQAYLERHFQLAEGFRGDLKPALVFERG
ncbi:MAG: hypothetical protein JRH10_19265, partial [Deltaproteobacteria bacterium]|nr:hypothetical protein [Deltaproteobacteria bacterium]